MTRVGILQHHDAETPGLIADALAAVGIERETIRADRGQRLPDDIRRWAGLVVMGGPPSVYEKDRYPFLRDELRLIESALRAGIPILGVCLGSQLLAAALGARIYPGHRKEIGWYPVTLTEAAAQDALLLGAPATFTPLHWHGDVFDLPAGAVALASSALTPLQAYRYGANVYGFLCHLEVTSRHVTEWVVAFADELRRANLDGATILTGAAQHLPALHTLGTTIFTGWAELVLHSRP